MIVANDGREIALAANKAAPFPVAVGRGWVTTEVPSSHGVCGGGEDSCGKSCRAFVPLVQAPVGCSFITVTLPMDENGVRESAGRRR